jgi:RNA polymerase sigma-70 factor (ECF subfamily)
MTDCADSWRACFDAHGRAMVLFARQFTATLEDAEDAVQEGFVRCWRRRPQGEDPTAYLFACVRTAALDQSRRQKRRARHEQTVAREAEPALFTCPVEQEERRLRVEQAIARLPVEQREVLVLKIWGDLTFDQIARVYGISINTVASRYRYALAALRQRFDLESRL